MPKVLGLFGAAASTAWLRGPVAARSLVLLAWMAAPSLGSRPRSLCARHGTAADCVAPRASAKATGHVGKAGRAQISKQHRCAGRRQQPSPPPAAAALLWTRPSASCCRNSPPAPPSS
jgi:hypothetical protein